MTLIDALNTYAKSGDIVTTYVAAMQAYAQNPTDDTRETLIEAIKAHETIVNPIDDWARTAWKNKLSSLPADAFQPIDQGDANTILEEIWSAMITSGFKGLPDYRQDQLTTALAQQLRGMATKMIGKSDPKALVVSLQACIQSGSLPAVPGADDLFKNFNDGQTLVVRMEKWKPILRTHKNTLPTGPTSGKIFQSKISFPSGYALVSDAVRIDPLPAMLMDEGLFRAININYAWPRVLRTSLAAHMYNVIDVAMGSDGPSMVQNSGTMVFAGQADDSFKEVADVCHDYWGTTLVDPTVLAQFMVEKQKADSLEDAHQQIDAWLAESDYHSKIEVPKEAWFYWDDDRSSLDNALETAGIDKPEDTRFVISPERLSITAMDITPRQKEAA